MRVFRRTSLALLIAVFLVSTILSSPHEQASKTWQVSFIKVQPAEGQATGIKSFVIMISHNGFNDTEASSLQITVNEGDRVQITFIMDKDERKDTDPINRHVIEIPELEIHTEEITPAHPEAKLVFLADKTGALTIRCSSETWDCPGHDRLQDARLEVKGKKEPTKEEAKPPPEQKPPTQDKLAPPEQQEQKPASQPEAKQQAEEKPSMPSPPRSLSTLLKLDVAVSCFPECPLSLKASLVDGEGKPIAGMPVVFAVNTTFGTMKIGSPYTNADGLASVNYSSARGGGLVFSALFAGGGGYGASKSDVVRQLPAVMAEPSQPLVTARNVAAGIVIAVVLSVWSIYLFVLRQIRGISQESRSLAKG